MQNYKYVIIGGGAAGVSAAETIRHGDQFGSIAIISDEPYVSYSRVMLSKPNFFLGKIPFDQIWLKTEKWYTENNIKFLGGRMAVGLDSKNKIIKLKDGLEIVYEKLLLANGVEARKWNIPGAEKKGIHYIRNLEQAKSIIDHIKTAKKALTIGGGFIGFEMADLLNLAGIDTTMVLRESYFWEPILDRASGEMIEKALEKAGIKILKNAEAVEVVGGDSVEGVILKNGTKLEADMVVCGIGTVSNLAWLQSAGLSINRGILANEFLETNLPDVWTAGDIAEYKDLLLEENIQMGNWVNAHEQGRIAGINMLGTEKKPFKFVSFYTTQGVEMTIAFVGDSNSGKDRIIIPRGSPEINSYARLIIVGKELVGATMINRTGDMSVISKLIEKNVDVSAHHADLGDIDFDLKKLLV